MLPVHNTVPVCGSRFNLFHTGHQATCKLVQGEDNPSASKQYWGAKRVVSRTTVRALLWASEAFEVLKWQAGRSRPYLTFRMSSLVCPIVKTNHLRFGKASKVDYMASE